MNAEELPHRGSLVVTAKTTARAGPELDSAFVRDLLEGEIVKVFEERICEDRDRVRIGTDMWVSRTTAKGRTLLKEIEPFDMRAFLESALLSDYHQTLCDHFKPRMSTPWGKDDLFMLDDAQLQALGMSNVEIRRLRRELKCEETGAGGGSDEGGGSMTTNPMGMGMAMNQTTTVTVSGLPRAPNSNAPANIMGSSAQLPQQHELCLLCACCCWKCSVYHKFPECCCSFTSKSECCCCKDVCQCRMSFDRFACCFATGESYCFDSKNCWGGDGGCSDCKCCHIGAKTVCCCCEESGTMSCAMPTTCCKGGNQCCCLDDRCALPCDNEVPFQIGLCGIFCIGGKQAVAPVASESLSISLSSSMQMESTASVSVLAMER